MTEPAFDVLINPRSTNVLHMGAAEAEAALRGVLGGRIGEVMHVHGSDVAARMKDWAQKHKGGGRDIMVVSGDGTLQTVAEAVLPHPAIRIAPLPGGLYCITPRHLGFPPGLLDAAALYRDGAVEPFETDIGTANGRVFLYSMLLDKNGVGIFAAHEDFRDKRIAAGVLKILRSLGGLMAGRRLELRVSAPGGAARECGGRLVAVVCNHLRPRANTGSPLAPGKYKDILENAAGRGSFDDGMVSLYTMDNRGLADFFRGVAGMWDGSWSAQPFIGVQSAPALDVLPAASAGPWRIVMDGDIKEASAPLAIRNVRGGFRTYRRKEAT